MVMAGSWLIASVYIERIKATSSTHLENHGSNSEFIHMPLLPNCANLYFDGAMGKRVCFEVIVVRRWPWRMLSGRSLSYHFAISGL